MIETSGKRRSEKSVIVAHDDDDDDNILWLNFGISRLSVSLLLTLVPLLIKYFQLCY